MATWPQATVQTCVVHLVRNSLRYASKKYWAQISRDLKQIYNAPRVEGAESESEFDALAATWEQLYPGNGRDVATLRGGVRPVPRLPGRDQVDHLQARRRGEIGDAPIPDAVLAMPGMLIRYSMIAERAAPSDEALEHIADQLFLPLVLYHAAL